MHAMEGTLWQASTLGAIVLGHYDPTVTLGRALEHGDVGIGTFEGLGGEMIVLNGVAYNGTATGRVEVLRPDMQVSFCTMAPFDHYAPVFLSGCVDDIPAFETVLDGRREVARAKNSLHAVVATGTMSHTTIRSVARQSKPYLPLDEVARDQSVFELDGVEGTIVGVRYPAYLSGVNLPGWHLHLITEDRRHAGHLLAFSGASLACQITRFDDLEMMLPRDRSFSELDLAEDLTARTAAAEGARGAAR